MAVPGVRATAVAATVPGVRFVAAVFVFGALVSGVAGAGTIVGTPQNDRLVGTAKPDSIDGRAGNDTLRGLAGGDFLQGGAGRDTVDAGGGDDRIAAHADGAVDRVRCGAGRDIVDAEQNDIVAGDCEVVSRQLSVDTTANPIGQHATEVEPDSYAFGSTIVSVFQVGRVFGGGAVAIGYSTSTNGGTTWKPGLLPGVTASSPQPGVAERASDPSIAYDAVHHTWLATTLAISPATSSFYLYVSRSVDGRTWSQPMIAVSGRSGDLDKQWINCDDGTESTFAGHCYLSYFHVPSGELRTATSTDGGATWGTPVASSPVPPRGIEYNGAQPEVLPDGTLVLVYNVFVDENQSEEGDGPDEIDATRSTDGGASFSAPVVASRFTAASIPGIRTESLSSSEVDSAGRVYVAWEGCPGDGRCSASRILLTSSTDGITWTPTRRVTTGAPTVDHFIPGLAANPAASGKLALAYQEIPDNCVNVSGCRGIDIFQQTSSNGGATWSKRQRITAESMKLPWLARTSLGLMLGDYVSSSYLGGRPVSVVVIAAPPVGSAFREAAFAYRPRD